MPAKKRVGKVKPYRITEEVVEAYQARDYMRLHTALSLPPWTPSPLPLQDETLGVEPGMEITHSAGSAWAAGIPLALEIQADIEAEIAKRGGRHGA